MTKVPSARQAGPTLSARDERLAGHINAGPVTDRMMQRARKRAQGQGGKASAEVRLQGIWAGAVAVPVGLIMCVINTPSW